MLKSQDGWDRARIAGALLDLMQVPHIEFVQRDAVAFARERYAEGADFADMLHLALSRGADAFVTFDKDIARHAGAGSPVPVETL